MSVRFNLALGSREPWSAGARSITLRGSSTHEHSITVPLLLAPICADRCFLYSSLQCLHCLLTSPSDKNIPNFAFHKRLHLFGWNVQSLSLGLPSNDVELQSLMLCLCYVRMHSFCIMMEGEIWAFIDLWLHVWTHREVHRWVMSWRSQLKSTEWNQRSYLWINLDFSFGKHCLHHFFLWHGLKLHWILPLCFFSLWF